MFDPQSWFIYYRLLCCYFQPGLKIKWNYPQSPDLETFVKHLLLNQKLTCCLYIPSFVLTSAGHLTGHTAYHFDWKKKKNSNSKIWWNVTGSYLLSAQGRTPLVELLLSLLSPDLKGKHAFLLTFCNSLHGHSTIWLAVRKPEVFSVINSVLIHIFCWRKVAEESVQDLCLFQKK